MIRRLGCLRPSQRARRLVRHVPCLLAAGLTWAGVAAAAETTVRPNVVSRNGPDTVARLCVQSRLGQADAQFDLAWIYAHSLEGQRRHDWAAYLLRAAAAKGHAAAKRTLQAVDWPAPVTPDCLLALGSAKLLAAHKAEELPPRVSVDAPPRIEYLVRLLAPRYRVPPRLALAIIDVESRFDPNAVSPKNAKGLMQLIPETAERFGVRNPFDARQNIEGGLAYLRWLTAYFEGNVTLVAAAYNAGEGAVDRHSGVPPFPETRDYVRKVIDRTGTGKLPFDPRITAPSPQIEALRRTVFALE
jgi:soluble lytic murein transglycosylase-like protein